MGLNASSPQMLAMESGFPDPDNAHVTAEFTTYSKPSIVTDTRRWDVFTGCPLAMYNGQDGYVYGFLSEAFGSKWNGPSTTATNAGNTTIAAGSNNVTLSTLTGTQSISLAAAGSFTTTGGHAVVQLSDDSNNLAYIKYGSRTTTTLFNCKLIYAPNSTKQLKTGDRIRGDDNWTDADLRDNTLFRSATTSLSSGFAIDSFKNLNSLSIAKQAIPGNQATKSSNNVFAVSRTITAISVTSNLVTVTVNSAHKIVVGQPVTISGVSDSGFNGSFSVTSIVSNTKFTYSLTKANSSSSGGTAIGSAPISTISASANLVTVTTSINHGLTPGMGVLIAGTSVANGDFYVYTTPSNTQFTYYSTGATGSGSSGTAQPASFAFADPTDPANGVESYTVPTGAVVVDGSKAIDIIGDSITSETTYGFGPNLRTDLTTRGYTLGMIDINATPGKRSDEQLPYVQNSVNMQRRAMWCFLGTNDFLQDSVNSGAPTDIEVAQANLLATLDSAHPDTVIIVATVQELWDYVAAINGYTGPALGAQWNDNLTAWLATRPNTYLVDWNQATIDNPSLLQADSLHPSATGKQWLSDQVTTILDAHMPISSVLQGNDSKCQIAYYDSQTWLSSTSGIAFTNYMGVAVSSDHGDTWSRYGVTGATYTNADINRVWSNNSTWTNNFQMAAPIDIGDNYIYCLCTASHGRGDAYLMRVPKVDVRVKELYTYWNGSSWTSTQSAATAIYTGPHGPPSIIYNAATEKFISIYLDSTYGDKKIVMRSASSLTGTWSSKVSLVNNSDFGNQDLRGGVIHPLSGSGSNGSNDIYFLVGLTAPNNSYLMKTTLSSDRASDFFQILHSPLQ